MAKIKGVCHNFDNCDMAADKVVQEAEKTHFVCEECGKPLYPVTTETLPWWKRHKRLLICIGLFLGVAAVAGGIVSAGISAKKRGVIRHEEKMQQMRLDSIARARQDSILRMQIEQARIDSIEQAARLDSIESAPPRIYRASRKTKAAECAECHKTGSRSFAIVWQMVWCLEKWQAAWYGDDDLYPISPH